MLGFTCYPGTLNINVKNKPFFEEAKKLVIKPNEEDLSQVDCYVVKINESTNGAIVIPHKTIHNHEIIELVAPVYLREKLNLHDGDEIPCELE